MSITTCATDMTLNSADGLNRQGMARFAEGDLAGALNDFRAALRLRPDYPEAWNNTGIVRQTLGETVEAVDDFGRALAFKPEYAEALNNRARAQATLGNVESALADFARAVNCAAGRFLATVHHNRGTLRQTLGDLAGALADFDRALDVDPEHMVTHLNRGMARKEAGDLDGALADLDRALEITPPSDAAPVYHARGGVRVLQNDFTGAIADYDETLRINPTWHVAYISRGNAHYHRRSRRGLADYLTAFALHADGAADELIRTLLEGIKRGADEVLANCDQHLRLDERDILAHARRGLTLVLLEREVEAAQDLSRFREAAPNCAAHVDRILTRIRVRCAASPTPRTERPVAVSPAVQADQVFARGDCAGWGLPVMGAHSLQG